MHIVCVCVSQRSKLGRSLIIHHLILWRQGLSLSLKLISSASQRSTCFCLPSREGGMHCSPHDRQESELTFSCTHSFEDWAISLTFLSFSTCFSFLPFLSLLPLSSLFSFSLFFHSFLFPFFPPSFFFCLPFQLLSFLPSPFSPSYFSSFSSSPSSSFCWCWELSLEAHSVLYKWTKSPALRSPFLTDGTMFMGLYFQLNLVVEKPFELDKCWEWAVTGLLWCASYDFWPP